jgi:hypothetical protein
MGFLRPSAQGQRKPLSPTMRFLIGWITLVVVAQVLLYLVTLASVQFKINLNQTVFGASASWLTWLFAINIVIILGAWIVLSRLGFFPRDMWTPRNGTTTTARGSSSGGKSSGGSSKSANAIPGIGKARTRAERRHTATVKAAAPTNSKGRTAATGSAVDEASFSAEHDDVYDRVRAAQRLRKRRALR